MNDKISKPAAAPVAGGQSSKTPVTAAKTETPAATPAAAPAPVPAAARGSGPVPTPAVATKTAKASSSAPDDKDAVGGPPSGADKSPKDAQPLTPPLASGTASTSPAAQPALILYRYDQDRAFAAWFDRSEAELARKAADQTDHKVLLVERASDHDEVLKLPRGRVHEAGTGLAPALRTALLPVLRGLIDGLSPLVGSDRLAQPVQSKATPAPQGKVGPAQVLSSATPERAKPGGGPAAAASLAPQPTQTVPDGFYTLEVGTMALIRDRDPDFGWYEVIILEVLANGQYRVRWREFVKEKPFIVSRAEFSYLPAKVTAAI